MNTTSTLLRAVRAHGRLLALSAALLLSTAVGCDGGCGSQAEMPQEAKDRLDQMAGQLPADVEMTYVVSDLERLRTSLENARETVGESVPMAELVEEQARAELGIDLFDAESWQEAGVAKDGALTMSLVGENPVVLTYVDDQQKFEKFLAEQLNDRFGTEAATKSEKVGDIQVKSLGEEPNKTAAWSHLGELVVIGLPDVDGIDQVSETEGADTVEQLVADLISLEKEASLASLESYDKFNRALGSTRAMALFLNNSEAVTEERIENLKENAAPNWASLLDWTDRNIAASGLSLDIDANSIGMRGWADLPEEVRERADKVLEPADGTSLANFATENTMLAVRMSVDPAELWKLYEETSSEEERAQLVDQIERDLSEVDLELQADIIDKLTGNLALYFYGLDLASLPGSVSGAFPALLQRPFQLTALIVPVEFEDKESRDKIIEALIEAGDGEFERAAIEGDVHVLKPREEDDSLARIYYKDRLLVFATGVFSEDSIYEYIEGERDEKNLGEVDQLDLGKQLAEADGYNGVYANFVRAKEHLGQMLRADQPRVLAILEKLEEAALTTEVDQTGAIFDLTVDLTPQANDDGRESNQ